MSGETSNLLPGETYCENLFERLAAEDPERLLRMVGSGELEWFDLTFAAEYLGNSSLSSERLAASLLPLLAHGRPVVREGALLGLYLCRTPEVIAAVTAMLGDPIREVCVTARRCLESLMEDE
jgi:hypothetical protein